MNESIDKSHRAQKLFDVGDFRQARRLAKEILKSSDASSDAIDSAHHIVKATGTDPAAVTVFALTFAVLAFLVVKYIVL